MIHTMMNWRDSSGMLLLQCFYFCILCVFFFLVRRACFLNGKFCYLLNVVCTESYEEYYCYSEAYRDNTVLRSVCINTTVNGYLKLGSRMQAPKCNGG